MFKNNSSAKYDGLVIALLVAMFILVLATIGWVVTDFFINRSYHEQVKSRLEKIEYITVDAVEFADSSDLFEGKYLTGKDIKDLLDQKIASESTIIDSNNYLAIILTLITLCVSLSVVIPYIVGRTVSSKDIKDRVDELYTQQAYDSAKRYNENVNMLLASEAHLSRMISYLLLSDYSYHSSSTTPREIHNKFRVQKHPAWAMGWASKALLRYVVIDKESYRLFCQDLCCYILYCKNKLGSNINAYEGIVERAFYDLLNALVYHKILGNKMLDGSVSNLKECLNKLASHLYKEKQITRDQLQNGAILKSHKDQYLDSDYMIAKYIEAVGNITAEVIKYLDKEKNTTKK